jgi:hypothetical protein
MTTKEKDLVPALQAAVLKRFYIATTNPKVMKCTQDGCTCSPSQDPEAGVGNLFKHLRTKKHRVSYEAAVLEEQEKLAINKFYPPKISEKVHAIYGWLDWMVSSNLPMSIVENAAFRKFSKLPSCSVVSIKKYMERVSEKVCEALADELPENFGVAFDGWTDGTTSHYIAMFAVFTDANDAPRCHLLAFQPLLDETDLGADAHKEFFESTLEYYNCKLSNVLYLSGDNCSVNTALSERTGIPLVGCASHRFNLAVTAWLDAKHKVLLDRLYALFAALSTIKYTAKLRSRGAGLVALKRCATRWLAIMLIVARHERIKESIYSPDFPLKPGDLDHVLLTASERTKLVRLLPQLKILQHFTVRLQKPDLTLLQVRTYFDAVCESFTNDGHEHFQKYLSPDADIVHNKTFETAVVTALRNDPERPLTAAEMQAIGRFQVAAPVAAPMPADLTPLQRADHLLAQQQAVRNFVQFRGLAHIVPTSNLVERFFSQAKLVQSPHRRAILPKTFEQIMYLKVNRSLWNVESLAKVEKAVNEDVDEGVDEEEGM